MSVLAFGRGQDFFGHFGHGQTAKRPTANPGQMPNGQCANTDLFYVMLQKYIKNTILKNFFSFLYKM
jgi:hypothetical protein